MPEETWLSWQVRARGHCGSRELPPSASGSETSGSRGDSQAKQSAKRLRRVRTHRCIAIHLAAGRQNEGFLLDAQHSCPTRSPNCRCKERPTLYQEKNRTSAIQGTLLLP